MARIYCFTSTGNSLYAAKQIAGEINGVVLPMNSIPTTCDDNIVGFVFPVYFWGLPRIVARFLSEIQISGKETYVFAVLTSGGPVFGVRGLLKKLLKLKGITLQYSTGLVSVTNYLPKNTVNDSEERRRKSDENLRRIIGEIKNRTANHASSFTAINSLIYKIFPNENSDRHFTVSEKCTGCSTCQKICPVNNIVMENGRPYFQNQCEHCLGCLHGCPAAAIDWKQKTQGKQRYRHPNIGLDELISFSK
jgi:ferredoxin